ARRVRRAALRSRREELRRGTAATTGPRDMRSPSQPQGERRPPIAGIGPRASAIPWSWQLAFMFCLAWGWRLIYLYRLERSPLAGPLTSDEVTYWEWAGSILRTGPIGHHPFFMGPLYPHVLALLRLFAGESVAGVRFAQSLWG